MNVMLIDDDQECLDSLDSALRLNGFAVRCFSSPVQALHTYRQNCNAIDVVITDFNLPDMTGTELLTELHQGEKHPPVIIISGESRQTVENQSLKAGACAFFAKPLNVKKLIGKLKQLARLSKKTQ